MIDLIRQWYDVNRAVDQALASTLDDHGLAESTGSALWAIGLSPTPLTLRGLATRLACDPTPPWSPTSLKSTD
jgi:hypothetical protein